MPIYVKPAFGKAVRVPHTDGHLPACGAYVEDSPYWRRRIEDGAAVRATAPGAIEAKAAIDACSVLLATAVKAARAAGTIEGAKAARAAFEDASEPVRQRAEELAANMTEAEQNEVDAYGSVRLGHGLAELAALAAGEPVPVPVGKSKRKRNDPA